MVWDKCAEAGKNLMDGCEDDSFLFFSLLRLGTTTVLMYDAMVSAAHSEGIDCEIGTDELGF